MNIAEAKSILHGYRPCGGDAADPVFREALELARNDSGLGEWFAQQQAFDAAATADFETAEAPAGLRDSILAAAAAQERRTNYRTWWNRRLRIRFAMAAGLIVLVTLVLTLRPTPTVPAANSPLADFAIEDAQHPKTHGGHGDEEALLKKTLKLPTTKLGSPLQLDFASLHNTGCRTVHVEGRDVLEVCFKRNGVGLHCYIARREDFPTLTAPTKPEITDKTLACVASWSDNANLYLVVTAPDHAAVEKLL